MAHSAGGPRLYACKGCRSVHAGDHDPTTKEQEYTPPKGCKACGHEEFVEIQSMR